MRSANLWRFVASGTQKAQLDSNRLAFEDWQGGFDIRERTEIDQRLNELCY